MRTCELGKVDYTGKGRRDHAVTLEWSLENGRFSMSGAIWNRLRTDWKVGGQCMDSIAALFPANALVQEMVTVWRRWHLNDLRAGCEHQRALGWGHGKDIALAATDCTDAQRRVLAAAALAAVTKPRTDYAALARGRLVDLPTERRRFLEAHGMESTVANHENVAAAAAFRGTRWTGRLGLDAEVRHWCANAAVAAHPAAPFAGAIYKDSLGAPCPTCGYRYGTQWVKEEIPADVLALIKSWPARIAQMQADAPADPDDDPASWDLATWLDRIDVDTNVQKVDSNPNADDMPAGSTHFRVKFRRKDGRRMTVFYSQGPGHESEPEPAAVLGCALLDARYADDAASFEDFCSELGYDPDSRKADRAFKACRAQALKLRAFLGLEFKTLSEAV